MVIEKLKKSYFQRRTLWDMSVSQLKAKYGGSRLGIWWAVFIPLLLAVSINFVFNIVFKVEIANYTLFLLAGIIPWFLFSSSLEQATNSFITNIPILKQGVFPKEFLPASLVVANLFNFLIGFIFLLPLFILLNLKVIVLLPFLLIIILLQFIFLVGLAWIFSVANVFFRDISYFLSTVLMVWFWITPVFYSLSSVPSSLRWICFLNPMSHFVLLYQKVLFSCRVPSFVEFISAFFIAILFFFSGYLVFIKKESQILKRI